MALSFALAGSVHNETDLSEYTLSVNLVAGRLYFFPYMTAHGTLEAPAVSALSVTGISSWTDLGSQIWSGSPGVRKCGAWWAWAASSQTGVTLTVTLSGNLPSTCLDAALVEVDGADATTPIVQTKFPANGTANYNDFAVTFDAAFGAAANRAVALITRRVAELATPGTDCTELDDATHAAPSAGTSILYTNAVGEETPSCSWTTANHVGAAAVEVKAATTSGPTWYPHEGVQPFSSIWRPGRA